MKRLFYAFILLNVLGLAGCDANTVVDENTIITDKSWPYNVIPKVKAHITDKNAKYDVYLNLRHNGDYRYANIFVRIHETNPKGVSKKERRELKLAELDGRWTGNSAGSLYAHQALIHENYSFPDTGIYTFAIEQNMRENPLKDINDVGIKIVKR
ncbi:gliding motility-associated lipoprotein GldH [Sphingobacterium spiritivorum ATCC 33300]|uniref:Gliding motility lipoprotein gldH n=2 Tax=Sphingobacterium spiritivorum TaxID=258 RepID=A0A380CBH5_SPHSI|nr:gliding motility lipoprotein GldH [Sphingobacterium spiritivorum]EEI90940.1 gliding motility-associated lipoprotein GldH [Sphingobacterium spiritivorum ATCC 33300]QQS97822.1 gliding motility lipoprotein GldH [Sphingobacterium spiritivorum]SUJ15473.1 Gliding motility lipoprotein gldH precursor [Sphingobacterium spiritivorum]